MHSQSPAALLYCSVLLLCLSVLPLHTASAKDPIMGFIDSFGYGYTVKVSINGTPIKVIKGKGQQATRLFSADHPMRKQASAEQMDLFILREGENSLVVEFQKLEDAQTPLQVKLEIPDRYSIPLFHLTSSTQKKGKVERKFEIKKKMPAKFKTIEVNDKTM